MRRNRLRALCGVLLAVLALSTPAAVIAAPSGSSGSAEARLGDTPLLVVVDTSGSMDGDDENGVLKIDSAKRSVLSIEENQVNGTRMGVWTYPGDSSCDPGGFVPGLDMPRLDQRVRTELTSDVLALEADGDTPTGPALEAAAEALRAQGYPGATMVLISDGESTCGGNPCEVAQRIVADGFDLQVHGVGFALSGRGREELECIAQETNGRYFDVADGAQLIATTKAMSQRSLRVEVDAPATAIGGGMVSLGATVTNTSTTESAPDIALSLAFTEGTDLFPRVVPPRVRLGNLGPGATSTTYRWDLPVMSSDADRTARWRVVATSSNGAYHQASETVTVVKGDDYQAVAVGFLRELMDSADARVGVFGDSYASGEGAGEYVAGTAEVDELCHRSDLTHVAQLFGADKTRNYACSGAVRSALTAPYPTRVENWSQIEEMGNGDTLDAAFLSIGGNDIGFGGIVEQCLASECGQADATATGDPVSDRIQDAPLRRRIENLGNGDALPATYTRLYDALNIERYLDDRDGREAPLFVLGYPKPFPEITGVGCGEFSPREVTFANRVVGELNATIAQSVAKAATAGRHIYFVDSVEHAMQPANTLCDGEATGVVGVGALEGFYEKKINGFTARDQEFVHPNLLGYGRIAGAIATWSTTGTAPDTVDSGTARTAPPVVTRVETSECVPWELTEVSPNAGAAPGMCVLVRGHTLRTGTAWAEVHSTPTTLAAVRVEAGTDLVLYLPPDLPAGRHTLHLTNIAEDGTEQTYQVALTVAEPLPWWWTALAVASTVALLAGAALWWRARRTPR